MSLSDSDDHGDRWHANANAELKGRKPAVRTTSRVKVSRQSAGIHLFARAFSSCHISGTCVIEPGQRLHHLQHPFPQKALDQERMKGPVFFLGWSKCFEVFSVV